MYNYIRSYDEDTQNYKNCATYISDFLSNVCIFYFIDKYVIIGSHIDSWIQGAVDSGTGYTVIQELARTFAYHIGKGT